MYVQANIFHKTIRFQTATLLVSITQNNNIACCKLPVDLELGSNSCDCALIATACPPCMRILLFYAPKLPRGANLSQWKGILSPR